ncbi:hypothetical protein ACIOWE_22585 [Pseudomonas sp. NPDC087598]|uniref:InvB/SpaK family type III secretion system chaperone n=1 Tax=Pseudomonas sp. NPDC087598 TaxID=3364440 RepID=UPI00382CD54F
MVKEDVQDPYSFREQSRFTLKELMDALLRRYQCPEHKMLDFDQHSTIAIELDGVSDVFITVDDDRLWVWSVLADLRLPMLVANAAEVFSLLSNPVFGFETGQLVLSEGAEGYELKGLVDLRSLEHEPGFSLVIEQFHRRLEVLCTLIKEFPHADT